MIEIGGGETEHHILAEGDRERSNRRAGTKQKMGAGKDRG